MQNLKLLAAHISIHAPLRERLFNYSSLIIKKGFQSTLPCGSDRTNPVFRFAVFISIHAPLRERPGYNLFRSPIIEFQSTLPCGSDRKRH